MLITRKSTLSGVTRTLDLPITQDQYDRWAVGGALIQDAMPGLTADQREFIKTGISAEEWNLIFAEEE